MHAIVALSLLALSLLAAVHAQSAADFDLSISTYLGDISDTDEVVGVVILSNGNVVVAANAGPDTPLLINAPVFNLIEGTTNHGCLLLLSADGVTLLAAARVGQYIYDLDVDAQDNLYVAAGVQGTLSMDSTLSTLRWTYPAVNNSVGNVAITQRISVGPNSGLVVALATQIFTTINSTFLNLNSLPDIDTLPEQGYMTLFTLSGQFKAIYPGSKSSDRNTNDVVVDDVNQRIITIGWKQANDYYAGGPVQIGYIQAWTFAGQPSWTAYDWTTDNTDGATYLNEISVQERIVYGPNNVTVIYQSDVGSNNNMADTRLYRIAFGEDGILLATGHAAGGNNQYRYSPTNITDPAGSKLNSYDYFTSWAGAVDQHLGFIGRYAVTPDSITLLGSQAAVAHLNYQEPNTHHATGGGITGDIYGRLYLAGISAWGLPMWPNYVWTPVAGETTFNPFPGTSYLGGAFFEVFHWNNVSNAFDHRSLCTRLAAGSSNSRAVAVRTIDGTTHIAMGGRVDSTGGPIFTTSNALQSLPGYGQADGFFAVYLKGHSDVLTSVTSVVAQTPPGPIYSNGQYVSNVNIRNSSPQYINGLELDGEPNTVDSRFWYPFSATTPLTSSSGNTNGQNWTYSGPPYYGGLVMDIANATATKQLSFYEYAEYVTAMRMRFGDQCTQGSAFRMRGLVFWYLSDLFPGTSPSTAFVFGPASTLSFTFETFFVYDASGTYLLMTKTVQFIVLQDGIYYISQFASEWQTSTSNQFGPITLNFNTGLGNWAVWNVTSDVSFNYTAAEFVSMTFYDIQGVGFYMADTDWWEFPWLKPIPGISPPQYISNADQPGVRWNYMHFTSYYISLVQNLPPNIAPTAIFSASSVLLAIGELFTFDATASFDPDGTIVYYTWTFGDGTASSGPTPSKSYVNAGGYLVMLTVYDNDFATSTSSLYVYVVRSTASHYERSRTVGTWWGDPEPGAAGFFYYDSATNVNNIDLTGDGVALDQLMYVPYANISRPLSTTSMLGTRLFGGYRVEGHYSLSSTLPMPYAPILTGTVTINDGWLTNGIQLEGFGSDFTGCCFSPPSGGAPCCPVNATRFWFLWAIDKSDFLNDGSLLPVVFDSNSILIAGPLSECGTVETYRFAVRDGEEWFVSKLGYQSSQGHSKYSNNYGLAGNPRLNMTNPGSQLWIEWDPVASEMKTPDINGNGYATHTFTDITAFGLVIELPQFVYQQQLQTISVVNIEMQAAIQTQVATLPIASFRATPNGASSPADVTVDASASGSGLPIISYTWDFNDATVTTLTTASTSHFYALPGTYLIQLTIVDEIFRTNSTSVQVTVVDPLTGQAGPILGFSTGSLSLAPGTQNFSFILNRIGRPEGEVAVRWKTTFAGVSPSSGRISWAHLQTDPQSVQVQFIQTFSSSFQVQLYDTFNGARLDPSSSVLAVQPTQATSTSTPTASTPDTGSNQNSLSSAATIAIAVVISIVGLAIIIGLVVFFLRRRGGMNQSTNHTEMKEKE